VVGGGFFTRHWLTAKEETGRRIKAVSHPEPLVPFLFQSTSSFPPPTFLGEHSTPVTLIFYLFLRLPP
jgi:hypothetical protein